MSFHKYTLAIFSLLISLFAFSSCSKDDGGGGSDISVSDLTNYKWKLSWTEVDDNSAAKVTYTMYFGQNGKGFSTTKQTIADIGLADIWDSNTSDEFTYSISGSTVTLHDNTGSSSYTYSGNSLIPNFENAVGNMTRTSISTTEKALVRAYDGTSGTTSDDSWLVGTWQSTYTVGKTTTTDKITLNAGSTGTDNTTVLKGWSYEPSSKVLIMYPSKGSISMTIKSYVEGKSFTNGTLTYYKVGGGDSGNTTDTDSHEYVDLGLPSGTLWATCNIGANSAEEYGDYFLWGETTPKTSHFDYKYYKWCSGTNTTLTKYCTKSSNGTVDNKTELETSDDAATANWGGNWQTPSLTQIKELINSNYTTNKWTTKNGVYGTLITSKSNTSKYIFLPACGYGWGNSIAEKSSQGSYWSRTLDKDYTCLVYSIYTLKDECTWNEDVRCVGLPVRPVRKK